MRRVVLTLLLGLAIAIIAYCGFYFGGTATPRALRQSAQPELAWLKHEFQLNEADLTKVAQLHAGYLPQCMERCRQIDELNDRLANALASATTVTPEVEKLLNERAQLRAACQSEMLKHFFEVSRTMPPEQGRRYLTWVYENTCLREDAMGQSKLHPDANPTVPREH